MGCSQYQDAMSRVCGFTSEHAGRPHVAEPSRATHASIVHGWRLMWGSWVPCGASWEFSGRVVGTNMTLAKNYTNMLRPILRFMLALMRLTLGFLRFYFGTWNVLFDSF